MRLKRRHFGFNVIKESFDQLPTATCFFDSTGGVVLCNRRMYELSQYLLHSSIQYLAEAEQALASPSDGVVPLPMRRIRISFRIRRYGNLKKDRHGSLQRNLYTAYGCGCHSIASGVDTVCH